MKAASHRRTVDSSLVYRTRVHREYGSRQVKVRVSTRKSLNLTTLPRRLQRIMTTYDLTDAIK